MLETPVWRDMAQILILTASAESEVLPALHLLSHKFRAIPAEPASLVNAPSADLIFLDARHNLAAAKSIARLLNTTGLNTPLLAVVTEGGLAGISGEWGVGDIILDSAGPAEIDARIRLALARQTDSRDGEQIQTSGISIDEGSYTARVHGKPLDLTFKEFALLKFLAQHPGRVFTRDQLLSEVWGYDYFGGTRTVDVHIRRLRAKLGDLESLIGAVHNVGYRFAPAPEDNFSATAR